MAEPGLSELVTTTLRRRSGLLKDNVRNNNVVYKSMDENDGVINGISGRTILEEMAYQENATFTRYDGCQVLNTSYNPTITAAEFDPKQFAAAVVISGKEKRQNSGKEGIIKLLDARIKVAESTLENNLNADMLSDGTADGGKQIGGLKLLVSKTPNLGIVGGIDRGTAGGAFYRNFKLDTANDNIGTPAVGLTTATNVLDRLTYCIINTTRLTDRVKILLAGQAYYRSTMSSLQAIQRITDTANVGRVGFKALDVEGVPMYLGGGVSFGGEPLVQADLCYGLNTRYVKLYTWTGANMEPLEDQQSINQDCWVQLVVFMGNMTTSAPRLNFVMFDS